MDEALQLRGKAASFTRPQQLILLGLVIFGFWLRLHNLAAEGFADDEIHKVLGATRYLHGDFGGDDIEHPMLMKTLIALCFVIGRPLGWAPETMTRLPNVIVGGLSIWVVALLGRRLFGARAGLVAAALAAFSTTFIGYQRIAKEDTPLGFFLMLCLLALAEAKAAADDGRSDDQRRSETWGAVWLGAMLASKYFLFFAPIPLVAYLSMLGTGTRWRISAKRWVGLIGIAFLVFAALNFTPFLPSSWRYGLDYMAEKKTISGSLFFMGQLYHNLPSYGLHGTPFWFYLVFWAVKLAPPTVALAVVGLGLSIWFRAPSHRIVLSWLGFWYLILGISGSKWGRFTISATPAIFLMAAYALDSLARWVARGRVGSAVLVSLGMLVAGDELFVALVHAPHYRLYVNQFGGGDDEVDWFFPHCDYFDTGLREALQRLAAQAESNAEVVSEVTWPVRYYLDRFGRTDLSATLLRPDEACRAGKVCYVIVQTGRRYFFNKDALDHLALLPVWFIEPVNGRPTVRVYRLEAGQSPFP